MGWKAYTLFRVNQGLYMDFIDWGGVFRANENHWLWFKVLCVPHLHGEAFQESQLLVEQVIWRGEAEAAISPKTL